MLTRYHKAQTPILQKRLTLHTRLYILESSHINRDRRCWGLWRATPPYPGLQNKHIRYEKRKDRFTHLSHTLDQQPCSIAQSYWTRDTWKHNRKVDEDMLDGMEHKSLCWTLLLRTSASSRKLQAASELSDRQFRWFIGIFYWKSVVS